MAKTHQETLLLLEDEAAPPPMDDELEDPIVREEEIVSNWMTKNLCANPSSRSMKSGSKKKKSSVATSRFSKTKTIASLL